MPSLRLLIRLSPIGLILAATAAGAALRSTTPEIASEALRSVKVGNDAMQSALSQGAAWREFTARHGKWTVIWNEVTKTPHRAFGSGIPLPGFAEDPVAVDRAVRGFIADNPGIFGAARGLELVKAVPAGNVWYVRYRQTLAGIPMIFGTWEFRVAHNGKLFAFGADAHEPPAALLAAPRVGTGVAREAARAGLPFDAATDRVEGGTSLYILPYARDGSSYRLVYDVRVVTKKPRGNWFVLVDASSGDILYRRNRVVYSSTLGHPVEHGPIPRTRPVLETESGGLQQPMATISGRVTGRVHPSKPWDALSTLNFPSLNVIFGTTTVPTDVNGIYIYTCSGNSTAGAWLAGRWARTARADNPIANANFNSNPQPCPSTININWSDSPMNSQTSERDAYYHSTKAHDYIKALDPAYTGSDYDMLATVNSVDDECYTIWDGYSSIYGLEGSLCPYNMASMPDLVYRQYATRLNYDLYFSLGSTFGMENRALVAGTSDIMAAFMTNESTIGDGIEGAGTFLRDVNNTRRWPEDENGDSNETGLILAGALWDLKVSLGLSIAERLAHFAKYGLPGQPPPPVADDGVAMTEYFVETLVADDTDGDITNGTPHLNQIVNSFNAHGIGPSNFITITHLALEDQITNGPYPISALFQFSGPISALDLSSPTLYWSVNGTPFKAQPMTPTGNPDEWGGEIPAQSGGIVRYYVTARESYGGVKTEPGGAPARETFLFVAGPASTMISADMETDPGWVATKSPPIIPTNPVTGDWERVDPNSDGIASPEDDHTPIGTLCYITGQAPPGAVSVNDVDNGSVYLTTTTFSAVGGGMLNPIISYFRWFVNDGGNAPGEDPWLVEISNNGGSSWVPVETTYLSAFEWRRVVFFVKDYVTPTANMKLRFTASDIGFESLVEAGVDDFSLIAYTAPAAVGDPGATGSVALSPASPNPFRGLTRLRYSLPAAGTVELTAFDIHGRAVRRLVQGLERAGSHSVEWDGRDDRGRPVASGPYFMRLSQNGQRSSVAVVRIR